LDNPEECVQVQLPYHTLIASGFPIKMWEEWKKQCKEQYGDVYWMKIWTDHLKAQEYDRLS
jgi:hypothetical protein